MTLMFTHPPESPLPLISLLPSRSHCSPSHCSPPVPTVPHPTAPLPIPLLPIPLHLTAPYRAPPHFPSHSTSALQQQQPTSTFDAGPPGLVTGSAPLPLPLPALCSPLMSGVWCCLQWVWSSSAVLQTLFMCSGASGNHQHHSRKQHQHDNCCTMLTLAQHLPFYLFAYSRLPCHKNLIVQNGPAF